MKYLVEKQFIVEQNCLGEWEIYNRECSILYTSETTFTNALKTIWELLS